MTLVKTGEVDDNLTRDSVLTKLVVQECEYLINFMDEYETHFMIPSCLVMTRCPDPMVS